MATNQYTPHTGSQLTSGEGNNTTRTGVSTNIIISVDGNAVGAVTKLSIDESRSIAMIDEVGTDGHIDSVPKSSTNVTGSCTRTRFDNLRIAAAFSRGFVHVAAQRRPFDIMIFDIFAAREPETAGSDFSEYLVTTQIKNVWINKISVSYNSGDFVIVEDMSWDAEHIFSFVNDTTGAATGSKLPNVYVDSFEAQADLGLRRGALDAAGLINAVENV
jgi:hypothetical protein